MSRTSTPVLSLRRRQIVQVAALGILAPSAHSIQAAQLAMSTAINRAARFRALSQRCAKAYCQIALNVLPDDAQEVMSTAQHLIQRGFDDLSKGSFPPAVEQQIAAIQVEATALIKLTQVPPTTAGSSAVSAQADRMLTTADKATSSLEGLAQQASAKLVSLAGRQRMLSQRLAKNYFLAAAGLNSATVNDQLSKDVAAFTQAMTTLTESPLSTQHIRNELTLGQQQWLFFQSALSRKPDSLGLRTVATTSERTLQVMDNLTSLYDAALKDLLGQL